jgi:HlyD family secretion protein
MRLRLDRTRAGWSSTTAVLVLAALGVPFAAWGFLPDFMNQDAATDYLTTEVVVAPFEHTVLERGEIESSSNVEIRCEVRSRSSSGVNILEIVSEGSWVEEGDFLVRLDDAALQQELIQQQITVSNSQSLAIEAEAALEGARLSLEEYEKGTFRELEKQQESSVFVAKENVRRAEEYLRYSGRLAERGYISEVQLEADQFAVAKASKELEVAETKLEVLGTFTKMKMLNQLRADIATATARLESRRKTAELDTRHLAEIKEQIAKCVVKAPSAGQVVYANDASSRSSSGDLLIAEGRPVRERQIIVRLPDPNRMRVVAKVHESRISHVEPGLMADIVLDAFPDRKLLGRVTSVSEYPLPSVSVYMAHIKEYAVEIQIESPPVDLHPGMNAAVNMLVEKLESAPQIPLSSIIERDGRTFCAIPRTADDEQRFELREIKTGTGNEDNVIVTEGLTPGESIVLGIRDIEAELDLPEHSTDESRPLNGSKIDSPDDATGKSSGDKSARATEKKPKKKQKA